MSKPREFWIKKGFLNPEEGVCRLTAPTDWSGEYFTHAKLVLPGEDEIIQELVQALEKVCKRNDIEEAVLDYYGDCAMALDKYRKWVSDDK